MGLVAPVPLSTVAREWGRIGALGFGGPPAHVALLRDLTVDRRGWIDRREFEDAFAACNLLPGPASTQMSIYCAQRVAGRRGALVGGLAFILPGLLVCLVIAAVALAEKPPAALAWTAASGVVVPTPSRPASESTVTLTVPSPRRATTRETARLSRANDPPSAVTSTSS